MEKRGAAWWSVNRLLICIEMNKKVYGDRWRCAEMRGGLWVD